MSLSANAESRRALDTEWDGGGVRACLRQGYWNFAMRTSQLDYNPSIEPSFGLRRVFDKPTDWVRTAAICSDEFLRCPLIGSQFRDEKQFWVADIDTIYVSYVSSDLDFGGDLSSWPEDFTDFVAAHFAWKIAKRLTGSTEEEANAKDTMKMRRAECKGADAMDGPPQIPPLGTWSSARLGRYSSRRDGGSRTKLIG